MTEDIIGLIPMAGKASRLGKLPFSKELYPIEIDQEKSPKVVSSFLIESMKKAGVQNFHLVLRSGKWDIPSYFGSGTELDVNFCFHIAKYGYGVPFTINQAYPFIKNKTVFFGFPDILFEPKNAFNYLLNSLAKHDASVVLGSLPVKNHEKWDMIEIGKSGSVRKIHIKPKNANNTTHNWFVASWKPDFSEYLNNFVETLLHNKTELYLENNEYFFGEVLNSAIEKGMKVKYEVLSNGRCLDIGTFDGLSKLKTYFN